MKITAFGDLHLDSSFASYAYKDSPLRREELRRIFCEIISFVKENKSDLLFICGDLFDVPVPTEESILAVKEGLASLSIPVFIAPGNHDYYTEGSFYDSMPENVFVFKSEKLESVFLDSYGICVDGYAFTSDSHEENPLKDFVKTDDKTIHLLCAHTDLSPSSKYAPFTLNDLAKCDYSLALFGHIHKKREPIVAGICLALYSGVIQGRGNDEPINGSVNIIDIENGKISSLNEQSFAKWDNLVYQISADSASSDFEIISRINSELSVSGAIEKDTVRIELVGEHSFSYTPNTGFILSELKKGLITENITLKNSALPALDRTALLADPTVVGVLYKALFEDEVYDLRYSEEERLRAFRLALRVLKGEDVDYEKI